MNSLNSIISYVPQPYFITPGSQSVAGNLNIASIENEDGMFKLNLADYTTFNVLPSEQSFSFNVGWNYDGKGVGGYPRTFALLGCALLTYEDDGGAPDLATEFAEPVTCVIDGVVISTDYISFAHNSPNSVTTFGQQPLPSIISGGTMNLVFTGMPAATAGPDNDTATFIFHRLLANVTARPHAKLIVGQIFVGIEFSVVINPRNFQWSLGVRNKRFLARDAGALSSDGVLVRSCSGEILRIGNADITGQNVTGINFDVTIDVETESSPNFFDLMKINTSYPMLLNPFPYTVISSSNLASTPEVLNMLARQNFFSIYGFFDGALDLQMSDFRDGLNSEYRAQFRITETR